MTQAPTRQELEKLLPLLYPDQTEWLDRRLQDILEGRAFLRTHYHYQKLVGVVIGIHKPADRYKICTLYVHPEYRDMGIGGQLLDAAIKDARGSQVYITGPRVRRDDLILALRSRGIELHTTIPNRYGPDHYEDVYLQKGRTCLHLAPKRS